MSKRCSWLLPVLCCFVFDALSAPVYESPTDPRRPASWTAEQILPEQATLGPPGPNPFVNP